MNDRFHRPATTSPVAELSRAPVERDAPPRPRPTRRRPVDRHRSRRGSRAVALAVVLLVAAVSAVGVGAVPAAAAPTTHVVDASGGGDYTTIQAALDASVDGDTVEVRPGTYREQVSVGTNVTLVAPSGATLNGSTFASGSVGIAVDPSLSTGLVVEGFTIEGYGDGIGVGTSATEDAPGYHYDDYGESAIAGGWTIRGVTVQHNAEDGIDVAAASVAWTISDVTALHNGDDGIEAGGYGGSAAWTIRGTNASLNRDVGITVGLSEGDWRIVDSTTNGNFDGLGIGVYIVSRNSAWTIDNHTAAGNSFYGIDVAGSFSGDWTVSNATLVENGGSGINGVEGNWTVRDSLVAGNYDWGIRAGDPGAVFHLRNVTVEENSRGGIAASYTTGNWRIDDSTVRLNGDYRGDPGLSAEYTEGAWTVNNSTITGNTNAGITAEEGATDRPVGDATDNWWGQSSGPLAGQCVGNVDCVPYLESSPGGGTAGELDPYVDGGVVDTDGLRRAIDDWRVGDVDTALLRDIIDYWRTGESVE